MTKVTLKCTNGESFCAKGDKNSINLLIKWIKNYIKTHEEGEGSHSDDVEHNSNDEFYLCDPRMYAAARLKAIKLGVYKNTPKIPKYILV